MSEKYSTINGRVAIYCPEHPGANNRGYILNSRFVMEKHLGRMLQTAEEVHHKNGDKLDDSFSNLQLMTKSEHTKHHADSGDLCGRRVHDWDEIKCLYLSGLGCRRIAKQIGSVKSAVQYACHQMGIMRKRKG